jgi:hypothetical protein
MFLTIGRRLSRFEEKDVNLTKISEMYPQSHCHSSRMQNFSHGQAQQKTRKFRHHPSHQMVLYPTLNRGAKPQNRMPPQAAGRCPTIPPPPRTPPSRTPRMNPSRQLISPPVPHRVTSSPLPYLRYERIGDPSLRVFRLRLPRELASRLDGIIAHSERHAQALPGGWKTDLYSLTKQDMALRDIPGMTQRIHPVFDYISQAIQVLYGCRKVVVDKNQPHILKYSIQSGHTGGKSSQDFCVDIV